MGTESFTADLLTFLAASPTPFHAVSEMVQRLTNSGYTELVESETWDLKPGKYFVCRNGSSIIAFNIADKPASEDGFRMVGAHTDSPCLRLKPNPDIRFKNYLKAGVEVYGGALLNPWFDRDLSLAGRVALLQPNGEITHTLIDFERAIATIPSLCIHLDREANENRSIDKQKHILPIILQGEDSVKSLLSTELSRRAGPVIGEIQDYELCFYDTQPPAITGLNGEFVASARLDNLLSCYIGLMSLLDSQPATNCMLVCNDHEEVGSTSAAGAAGPFLRAVIARLGFSVEDSHRMIARSLLISCDNAHGIHPNYADRHDAQHGPILNSGPVIKINSNQRYATDAISSTYFRKLCRSANVPCQIFVNRSDLACGSTIGPITAAEVGVKTLDVGLATFAMHSIRETGGSHDPWYLYQVLNEFFQDTELPVN